jgi:hypothetical protein
MPYTGSMAGAFRSRHERATAAALQGGAQVVVNGLKEPKPNGLRGGYTSGAFVTGNVLNSVFVTPVRQDGAGWHVFVATDVMYAVYWEYGHYNIFLRRFVREERWRPTLDRTSDGVIAAYQRVYARFMS